MKKKSMIYGFFIFTLIVFFITSVKSQEIDQTDSSNVSYLLNITDFSLGEGEWRLYLVGVNHEGLTSTDSLRFFSEFKSKYIQAKKLCGLASDYNIIEVDGTKSLNATKKICSTFNKYVINNIDSHTMEFYGAYLNYFIYNTGKFKSVPLSSKLIDNQFNITLKKNENNNPYILILEKLDSTDTIYFTDPIDVPLVNESLIKDVDLLTIKVNELSLKPQNKFIITFSEVSTIQKESKVVLTKDVEEIIEEENPFTMYMILGSIVVFFLIVGPILYFRYRKIPVRSVYVESKPGSYEPASIDTS